LRAKFTQNILLLLVINFLIKPIYVLFIDAEVQNQVGTESYGVYFALFNFCFIFQILLDMGIVTYNSKQLSQNRDQGAAYFSDILGTKIFLIIGFLSAIVLSGLLLGYPSSYFPMILGLGAVMIFQSYFVFLRSNFSALGHFKVEAWLSALDKFLMIFILGYLVYFSSQITIQRFIYGQLASMLVAVSVGMILLNQKFRLSIKFSLERSLKLLKGSWPYAMTFILMILYTRIDAVMLERMLDDNGRAAGVYATGYRLLDAVNMIGYYFSILLIPMFAKQIGDKLPVKPLADTALGFLLTIATAVTLLCWAYAPDIMGFVYDDVTAENVLVFRLLMFGFWFLSLSYLFGSMISASGDLKAFNRMLVGGIVINWALNLWLIPTEGAAGAAVATAFTQGAVFLGELVLAIRMFKLRYTVTYVLKVIVFMILGAAIVWFVVEKLTFLWIFECLISGILLVIVSFLFGFLRLSWTD
jgi:O-antigen/teichoic acid export membrane protein